MNSAADMQLFLSFGMAWRMAWSDLSVDMGIENA